VFKDRSASEIVLILLTITVGIILFIATIGVITLRILHPQVDLKGAEGAVGTILTTIVGTVVGLVGGRSMGRVEPNSPKS
jgi:uncharacterized BrkB/YihY/UPF0761 family membrane protein